MSSKALIVVEGDVRECRLFAQMKKAFSCRMEMVPFEGNVSMLYDEMAKNDFMLDIVALLRAKTNDPERLKLLDDTYSDVFLVFDLDPQHSLKVRDGETPDDAMRRNAERICEKAGAMAKVMTESTDPTIGKLYVNYPGIESYRDADDFFDDNFARKQVKVRDLCKSAPFNGQGYKAISAQGRLTGKKRLNAYSAEDFSRLTLMNVFKLRWVIQGEWSFYSYDDFRQWSEQGVVLEKQAEKLGRELALWVLNTSLFLIIDYKGKVFYDDLCQCGPRGARAETCGE